MKSTTLRLSLVFAVILMGVFGTTVFAQDGDEDEEPTPILGALNIIVAEIWATPPGAQDEFTLGGPSVMAVGETIRTDATGVGLITWFYDGTESVIGPNSTLMLNDFSGDSETPFVVDLELSMGHLVSGLGDVADMSDTGSWVLHTPTASVKLLRGQFEASVDENGETTVIVTEGRVEVTPDGGDAFTLDENQYIVGAGGEVNTVSEDGVTTSLSGVCTATTPTNLNVRLAPGEDSRRLGGVQVGQVFWVRSATEGNLWLQVYYQTNPDDEEGHNYGWIYGPAVTFDDEAACAALIQSPLDAELYGGPGVDEGLGEAGETEPLTEEEEGEEAEEG